jgi:hypothetical protein
MDHLEERLPWFATATQAVRWFSWRRSVRFDEVAIDRGVMRAKISASAQKTLPPMRLRIHHPIRTHQFILANNYVHRDISFVRIEQGKSWQYLMTPCENQPSLTRNLQQSRMAETSKVNSFKGKHSHG